MCNFLSGNHYKLYKATCFYGLVHMFAKDCEALPWTVNGYPGFLITSCTNPETTGIRKL